MLDPTTNPNVRNTRDLLLRALNAIDSKVFPTDDYHAREHGRQIIPRHGGLSRTYRDPRSDSLISCTTCNSHGFKPDRTTCSDYGGSGRLVLDRARPERRW